MAIGISQPTTFILGYTRFQRNYLWDVLLPDIGVDLFGLVGFGIGQFVQKISFGDYSIDSENSMRYGAYEAHFAGLFTVKDVEITFLKTMPDVVSAYFQGWKELMLAKNGLYNVKEKYQKSIYVRFLDSTGLAVGRYKLTGCFPKNFPTYSLDYKDENITTVTVTFAVDKLEYEIL